MRSTAKTTFTAFLAVILPPGYGPAGAGRPNGLSSQERGVLEQYAIDTWQSFVAMVDPVTGLPADNVSAEGVRAAYTSPTNIGMYIWSTLAARDLQIITTSEAHDRIGKALDTVATLERHTPSGQFYNWYSPSTGAEADGLAADRWYRLPVPLVG